VQQAPINLTIFLPGAENSRWQFVKRCEEEGGRFLERRVRENACRIRGVVIEGWKRGWLYVRDGDYEL